MFRAVLLQSNHNAGLTSEATKTATKATETETRWPWTNSAVLWANFSETQVGA